MLDDARPTVLLIERRLMAKLPSPDAQIVCLDGSEDDPPCLRTPRRIPTATRGSSLAYVMYIVGIHGGAEGSQ